jgi:nicotinamidase-related amidase
MSFQNFRQKLHWKSENSTMVIGASSRAFVGPGARSASATWREAQRQYQEGRAAWKIEPDRTALVVIDLEEEFVKPGYSVHWIPDANRQLPKVKRLIEACRRRGIPIIYTCNIYHPKGYDAGLIPEVPVGIARSGMDHLFRKVDIVEVLIICGTMTNYCCGATAREAFFRGYRVVFGSDVNATDDPELYDAELRTLRRGYALVLSCEEILKELEG